METQEREKEMNKAAAGSVALVAGMVLVGANFLPKKDLPPPKTVQVERIAPVVAPKVPKAAVKPVKKSGKQQKTGAVKAKPRGAQQDFAADLRKLQDCKVLKQLSAAGQEPRNNYEQRLKDQLRPWYLRNCLFQ